MREGGNIHPAWGTRPTRIFPVWRLQEWQRCYFQTGLAGEGGAAKMKSNKQWSPGDHHGPSTSKTRVAPLRDWRAQLSGANARKTPYLRLRPATGRTQIDGAARAPQCPDFRRAPDRRKSFAR